MSTPTKLDLGHKIFEALSTLYARYSAPARNAPINEVIEANERLGEAVVALQALTASKIGGDVVVPNLDVQHRVVNMAILLKETRMVLQNHMKGNAYDLRFPGKTIYMKNLVDYNTYEVLAFVESETKHYVLTISPKGQYIFSEMSYWSEI